MACHAGIFSVSPLHSPFLYGALVPAEPLLKCTTIVSDASCQQVEYIHLELAWHGVLLDEGAPAETVLNAAEYAALYPHGRVIGELCAPRVENGFELEAIRRRLYEVGLHGIRLDHEGMRHFTIVRTAASSGRPSTGRRDSVGLVYVLTERSPIWRALSVAVGAEPAALGRGLAEINQ